MIRLIKKVSKGVRAKLQKYYSLSNQNKQLKKFRNIHKGKDFVLLGAGPSLDEIPHDFLEKFIVIGTNNSISYYKPNYWVVIDSKFSWMENGRKICFEKNIPAFINWIWANKKPKTNYPNEIILHPNKISTDQSPNNKQLKHTLRNVFEETEYIEKKGFTSVHSVIVEAAIPLALYMGCRNIYLAGVDFYTPKSTDNFSMKRTANDQIIIDKLTKRFQKEDNSEKDMWEYKRWGIEMIADTKIKDRVFNLSEKSSIKRIQKINYNNVKIQE
jgi:hypothetical protein